MRPLFPFTLVLAFWFGSGADCIAQSATYSYFGTGGRQACSPVQPRVGHRNLGLPVLGTSFAVEVPASNGNCGYLCNQWFLLTGFSRTSAAGTPLPFPLGCGDLLVSPDSIMSVPGGSSTQVLSLQIPNNMALVGLDFYQQAVAITYIFGGLNSIAPGYGGHGTIGF